MRVLICGTRYNIDKHETIVQNILGKLDPKTDIIIHGGATGVDTTVHRLAGKMGFKIECYFADWSLGKKAGPLRNQKMIDSKPDVVYAIPYPSLEKSIGTADTCKRAKAANIPVYIHI